VSVEKAAAELRQALACLPLDLLVQAATSFDEARTILAAVSQGTSRPEAGVAIQLLSQALDQVGETHGTASAARGLVEAYIAHIASGNQAASVPAPTQPPAPRPVVPARPPRSGVDKELVAEVQRRGDKISPDKVVRIEKPDRIIWLEEGDERAGLAHIMTNKRVADFARHGIAQDEIVDAVFTALTDGKPIGITGRDRVVYAVDYRGRPVRIAVSVGSNGFIVGANPFSLDQKVKPLP
jgi:hypothetical protein